jgi:hypothetical protein
MPGTFCVTGIIEPSYHGRSFKVYEIAEGKKIFVGLIAKKTLSELLSQKITVGDICKFSQNTAEEQESISSFSVELGGTKQ